MLGMPGEIEMGVGRNSDDMSRWWRVGDIADDDGRPYGWRLSDVLKV